MKKKYVQYLLLVIVVFLWGIIFYRIFNPNNNLEDVSNKGTILKPNTSKSLLTDTFIINAAYSNPFVTVIGDELEDGSSINETDNEIFQPVSMPVSWPQIYFYGIIDNKKNNAIKSVLLKINNSDNLIKPGEEVQGVKVLKVYKDSISLSYKGEYKTFKKYE